MNSEILKKLKEITPEEQKILRGDSDIDRSIYMESSKDVVNSKKMLSDGKQIAIRPHTRFVHFPRHTHDFVEIVYMCSGKTVHVINDKKIELKTGELLFLCQGATQEIFPAGENDIAINFIVLPEFFDGAIRMMGEENSPLKHFVVESLKNNRDSKGYLHFEVSDVLPVQNLIENLIWTLIYGTTNKHNINQITMGLLFLQLINHADRLVYQEKEDVAVIALRYIEEHYQKGSLNELAKIMHYDVSTLSREIKKETGKNYTTLVQEKRLSQACFMLKNTSLSIEDIACKIGYENVSFFFRLFKSRYRISPRQYRKT